MWLAGLIAILGSFLRLAAVRRRGRLAASTVYLCTSIGLIGLSAILAAPTTVAAAAGIEPFPNSIRLTANAAAMVSAWSVLAMLLHLVGGDQVHRSVRRQALLMAAAFLAMSVLLAGADTRADPDFVTEFGSEPGILGYIVVFCAYITWASGQFIWLIQRYIPLVSRRWLRRGLTVMAIGAGFAPVWAVVKTLLALMVFTTGSGLGGIETPLSAALSSACVALVAIGAIMPAWAPIITRPGRWWRRRRAFAALHPLWAALTRAFDGIQQPDEPHRPIDERLAQRVVEIRDGLLLLAPHRADSPESNSHLRRDDQATAEAAAISSALQARATGNAEVTAEPSAAAIGHDDLDSEVAWLSRVSRAYDALQHVPESSTT